MSDIIFNCTGCGQMLEVDDSGAGMEVSCPQCASPLTIPFPNKDNKNDARKTQQIPALGSAANPYGVTQRVPVVTASVALAKDAAKTTEPKSAVPEIAEPAKQPKPTNLVLLKIKIFFYFLLGLALAASLIAFAVTRKWA